MKQRAQWIAVTALGIALFVVFSIALRIPVFQRFYLCLGFCFGLGFNITALRRFPVRIGFQFVFCRLGRIRITGGYHGNKHE